MNILLLASKLSATSIVVVLTASLATAAPSPQAFRATLDIIQTVAPGSTKLCYAVGTIAAQGWATYLDAVTGTSQSCINTGGVSSFVFSSLQPLTLRGLQGNLFLCYEGKFIQASTRGVTYLIDGVYRIIGGTVTFQGARGYGTLHGIQDLSAVLTGRGHAILIGVITFGGVPSGSNEPDCSPVGTQGAPAP